MENMFKILISISFWFGPPCLSEMKELNQNILGKGLFKGLEKGTFNWWKGTWTIQKDWWRLNPPNRNMFLIHFIQIENFFFKKWTFNKASNPRMLYLSKIGSEFPIMIFMFTYFICHMHHKLSVTYVLTLDAEIFFVLSNYWKILSTILISINRVLFQYMHFQSV